MNYVAKNTAFAPNTLDRGAYRIRSTVTINGQPARRKVLLFEYPSMRVIDTQWSDPNTGIFDFSNIKERPGGAAYWGVMSPEYTRQYAPEMKIWLLAEPMDVV